MIEPELARTAVDAAANVNSQLSVFCKLFTSLAVCYQRFFRKLKRYFSLTCLRWIHSITDSAPTLSLLIFTSKARKDTTSGARRKLNTTRQISTASDSPIAANSLDHTPTSKNPAEAIADKTRLDASDNPDSSLYETPRVTTGIPSCPASTSRLGAKTEQRVWRCNWR